MRSSGTDGPVYAPKERYIMPKLDIEGIRVFIQHHFDLIEIKLSESFSEFNRFDSILSGAKLNYCRGYIQGFLCGLEKLLKDYSEEKEASTKNEDDDINFSLIIVTKLEKTSGSFPSQWEAETNDGRFIYIRYRFGRFEVSIGNTKDESILGTILMRRTYTHANMKYDGCMSTERMMELTNGILCFSKCEIKNEP